MKAFKRLSFSLNNRQPLTLLTTPYPGLFQSNRNWTFFVCFFTILISLLSALFSAAHPAPTPQHVPPKAVIRSGTHGPLFGKKKNQEGQIGEEEWTWVLSGFMHFVASYSAIRCPIWSCRLQYAVLCLRLHIESSLLTWFFNLALPAICCDWMEAGVSEVCILPSGLIKWKPGLAGYYAIQKNSFFKYFCYHLKLLNNISWLYI